MKNLCYQLVSLIPPHHFNPPKDFLSQQDQLEQAAYYIKKLRERIEELRRRKSENPNHHHHVLKLRDLGGSSLEVIFISGLIRKNIMLHQIIAILEQGGAEVVTVTISKIGDKIFHTLHAQAKVSRVGVDTTRICERFQELIYSS
ncbi:hypothetical protein RD792_014826 [Penstemon davidsonii]|uniref:BHLH domain-containing protein n=1 Tax=Penstemon davidsonii TaxID=160366 RepID=A0ABR0CR05_9LAMI|nr:hypothetical protein RD792_014826 [Penstemon davidsonii]